MGNHGDINRLIEKKKLQRRISKSKPSKMPHTVKGCYVLRTPSKCYFIKNTKRGYKELPYLGGAVKLFETKKQAEAFLKRCKRNFEIVHFEDYTFYM